jgi:hypothetical protein
MEATRINQAWWALRITFGVIPIVAGLDKYFNLLTNWEQYLSRLALAVSPISGFALLRVFGLVEIAVGVLVLTRWTRLGAYVASVWLALIAVNLVTTGQFLDIAARDAALAIAAFSLARLDEARGVVRSREPSRFVTAPAHV